MELRRYSPAQYEQAMALVGVAGVHEAARQTGVSAANVQKWAAAAGVKGPRESISRWLVAQSCTDCSTLLSASEFRHSNRGGISSYCRGCKYRRVEAVKAKHGPYESSRIARREHMRRLQRATVPTAERNGYHWTGPEIELVATRPDLSARELALILKRTAASIANMRGRLEEPRLRYLAGSSSART